MRLCSSFVYKKKPHHALASAQNGVFRHLVPKSEDMFTLKKKTEHMLAISKFWVKYKGTSASAQFSAQVQGL